MALDDTDGVIAVIENTAVKQNLGGVFEELAEIIDQVEDKSRIGVCLDTCHTFAAGYDLEQLKPVSRRLQNSTQCRFPVI